MVSYSQSNTIWCPIASHLVTLIGSDKVKDKTAQFQEKHDLEPKKNEFELTHNREVKKERSRDQGMSL